MITIKNLSKGDRIKNPIWGIGTVTQLSESKGSPAFYADFKDRMKVLWITEQDAQHFEHA